jgi:hypothetical protein
MILNSIFPALVREKETLLSLANFFIFLECEVQIIRAPRHVAVVALGWVERERKV